jgi:uncharacterized protein
VDVGVHQDGLVHVSAMSRTFVSDPHDVVKSGDIVRVKVLDVDIPRKRISLTLRLDDDAAPAGAPKSAPRAPRGDRRGAPPRQSRGGGSSPPPPASGAMADALRRAGLGGNAGV